jgi:hypothetical protein
MLPTPRRKDPRPAPHIMLSDHAACDFLSDFLAIFEVTSLIFWYVTWRLGVFSFDVGTINFVIRHEGTSSPNGCDVARA